MGQVLGGLTTFPMTSTMPDRARQQKLKSPESAKAMFAALRTEYESKLRIFDIQLMAHYGAVLDECDPWTSAAVKRSNELNVIMAIDLGAYWNLEGDKEVDALVDIRFEVADSLEGTSKERCASLMALGRKLLVVLGNRVRPYATSDTTPSEADRFNMSIAFSRSIALELEAAMRPAILQEDDTGKAQLKPQ